jgi:putative ABC transport system ATP-binding protein
VTATLLPDPDGRPQSDPPRGHPPLIELSGLLLRALPPTPVDLVVPRGEMVMLTGQPRSGRSGLLNVLGLLDRPAAGSYLLNGIDVAKLRDRDRSALRGRQIGFVFQRKMVLPTRSVLDNVMLPLRYLGLPRRHRIDAATESLDRVGLAEKADLMAWQLSADELALCAVARALVTSPSLVLFDEPTAGLHQSAATQVIGVVAGLHREGRTVVVATADQLAAAYSDRSVRLGEP